MDLKPRRTKINFSKVGRVASNLLSLFAVIVALVALLAVSDASKKTELSMQSVRERISIYAREDSYVVNGKDLLFYSDDRSTQTFSIDGATGDLVTSGSASLGATGTFTTGNAVVTGTLTLGDIAFSGPVRFGTASLSSGGTIAHGLGITPTAALLTANGTVTTTPFVSATDATSITVTFLATEASAMTVNWLAGK